MKDRRSHVFFWLLVTGAVLALLGIAIVFLPLFRCPDSEFHDLEITVNNSLPGKPSPPEILRCIRCGDRGRYSLYEEWRARREWGLTTIVY